MWGNADRPKRAWGIGFIAALSAAIALGALALVGSAAAKSPRVPTSIEIAWDTGESFSGEVSSPRKACIRKREITLLYFESEEDDSGAEVEDATTSKFGQWNITYPPPPAGGVYRAAVAKRKIEVRGDLVTCKKAISAPVTVGSAQVELSVNKTGAGSGTVISQPSGIDCGSSCTALFDYGQMVTLQASADAGSVFVGWSGEGCAGTSDCQMTMDQVRGVTATFVID
ncbi:MAG: hypothetical protein QOI31_817 [Solirubrobacterales bacterium]|nr:hypothetical protein [Solirubrobacterales bacterium]